MHEVICDWPTKEQVREHHGRHVRVAQTLNGLYFAWHQYQPRGYQPRHALPDGPVPVFTVFYQGPDEGFLLSIPDGGRQAVSVGPHTNYGQPCGGYGCDGIKLCDDCNLVVEEWDRERWQEYYDQIGPLNEYRTQGFDDHYTPGYFWPEA